MYIAKLPKSTTEQSTLLADHPQVVMIENARMNSGLRILDSKLIQKPCPIINMKLHPVGPRNASTSTQKTNSSV